MRPALSRLFTLAPALTALVLAGCSGDESPNVSQGAASDPKPAQSIKRLDAPFDRSVAYTTQLNALRLQTFAEANSTRPDPQGQVSHSNVAYTAAYRHSVYLNTLNSANYQPNGATGVSVGAPTDTITGDTPYATLRDETVTVGTSGGFAQLYPALYTNLSIYERLAAVVGGPGLLDGCSPSDVNEFYAFNGNIITDSGTPGQLRGFNLNARENANPSQYTFSPVDNIWYSSRGRTALMRASLKSWGYASVNDGNCICPPWPILSQRFLGTATTVNYAQKVARLGFWPNKGNTDVCPYGLDPDIAQVAGAANVRHDYSGPPIHITLPVAEPFLMNTTTFAGGISLRFRKMGGVPTDVLGQPTAKVDQVTQSVPNSEIIRTVAFRTSRPGLIRNLTYSGTIVDGARVAGAYDYSFVTSVSTYDAGDNLLDGELIMVPTEPLEPNSWYEVAVRLRTPSYVLPTGSTDSSEVYAWQFRTNGKTPY